MGSVLIETTENDASAHGCENCGSPALESFQVQSDNIFQYCPECLLYQKKNQPAPGHYEEAYHQCYEKRRGKKITTAMTRLGALTRHVDVDRPKMLDVGCSVGSTVEAAQRLGWDAHGVDISRVAVDFCRDKGLNCRAIDDHRLPYADNSFDILTSWHVIEHVEDASVTLNEWFRVLRPGGVLVLETPDSQCLKARRLGPSYETFWPHGHLYTFTRSNMCHYLQRAGFTILPSQVIGKVSALPIHLTLYATAYRTLRQAYRRFGWCKSIEVCCRKPSE